MLAKTQPSILLFLPCSSLLQSVHGVASRALIVAPTFNLANFNLFTIGLFLFLGILGTTIPFLLQNRIQKTLEANKIVIAFSLEPVWSALFAWAFGGESLTWQLYLGGGLILLAILYLVKKDKLKK